MISPHFFTTQDDFRQWLDKHHATETELLVGFYKTGSGRESMTWPQSVDQALCYGWIDGVRRSMGDESYSIRFTPRRPASIWSAVNIDKMNSLQQKGLVMPAGLAAFAKRTESKSKIYAHEQPEAAVLSPELLAQFKANTAAWEFFIKQAPSYRHVAIHIVMTAKQEKTKQSRFEKLLTASAAGKRIV